MTDKEIEVIEDVREIRVLEAGPRGRVTLGVDYADETVRIATLKKQEEEVDE